MNTFHFKKLFQFLLVLLFFTQLNSQNLSLTTPICNDDGPVTYSMYVNITDYLNNNNNIDKREFINNKDDLKNKTIAILPGTPINKSDYGEVITYSNTEDIINALRNHTIDGMIVDKNTNDYIVLHNYDLYKIPEKIDTIQYGPIFQKDANLLKEYDNFANNTNIPNIYEKWTGINYDSQHVDKNINGTNGTIKAIAYLGNRPYAYEDENGEATGSCIDLIYSFAKYAGYVVEFQKANSYDAQIDAINQKNANISCAYITDSLKSNNNISIASNIPEQDSYPIIRLSNSKTSNVNETQKYYESYKDLDGEHLGVLADSIFENITKTNFSRSNYTIYSDSFLLYKALFLGEIEGFLTDDPSAENFQRSFPEKVSYFKENFYVNYYGFAFNKNNSKLINEMNDFLKTQKLLELYPQWNIRDTSNLTVDRTTNKTAPKIRVAMFPDTKPICFEQKNEIIGYEIYLLYEFARAKNYDIEFIRLDNSADRINYIVEDKADITGGALTITDERRQKVGFSYPTLTADTALVVSRENRKLPGKIQALDENYTPKENNTIYFPVKIGDNDTVSECVFPENYNYGEYTLINCTISNLNGADPTKNGLKLGNATDTLVLNNVEYNPTNLLNANPLLGRNITLESDKTDYICYVAPSPNATVDIPSTVVTTIPSTVTTTTPSTVTTTIPSTVTTTTPSTVTTTIPSTTTPTTVTTTIPSTTIAIKNSTYHKKYEKGLSTGAIIGIIIACLVVVTGVTIASFLCRRVAHLPEPPYAYRLDKSNYKLNVPPPQYVMQQVEVRQVPVQPIPPVNPNIPTN